MSLSHHISIPPWKFSCTGCGECCRRWHVALSPAEKQRLARLEWLPEDGIPAKTFTVINGYDYLAHTPEGYCVFLEPEGNVCKIHRRFGYQHKPLGCKVYPYNIATTFPNEISVIGRFDCPAVRDNQGTPIVAEMSAIREFIDQMGLRGGFDQDMMDRLTVVKLKKIISGFFDYIFSQKSSDICVRMTAANLIVERLEKLGAEFLNQDYAVDILPALFERALEDVKLMPIKPLRAPERWRFLMMLISYLRRDEEIIDRGFRRRLERTLLMSRLVFSRGNLSQLGTEHPDAIIAGAHLFSAPLPDPSEIDWSPYLDLVKLRLQAYQFFGPTNYNLSFFIGLKSLFFSFPLVAAAAKWSALARNPHECRILPNDIDYAVGVIDHNLGRSALLAKGIYTLMTRQMSENEAYNKLLHALIH